MPKRSVVALSFLLLASVLAVAACGNGTERLPNDAGNANGVESPEPEQTPDSPPEATDDHVGEDETRSSSATPNAAEFIADEAMSLEPRQVLFFHTEW